MKPLFIGLGVALAIAGSGEHASAQIYYPQTYTGGYAPAYQQPQPTTYIPSVQYRMVWRQVPITTYVPLASIDPSTGFQVTYMRPYTTLQWQAQQETVEVRPMFNSTIEAMNQSSGVRATYETSLQTTYGEPKQTTYEAPLQSAPGSVEWRFQLIDDQLFKLQKEIDRMKKPPPTP